METNNITITQDLLDEIIKGAFLNGHQYTQMFPHVNVEDCDDEITETQNNLRQQFKLDNQDNIQGIEFSNLIDKFRNGINRYQTDATFNIIINQIIQGQSKISIIDELLIKLTGNDSIIRGLTHNYVIVDDIVDPSEKDLQEEIFKMNQSMISCYRPCPECGSTDVRPFEDKKKDLLFCNKCFKIYDRIKID